MKNEPLPLLTLHDILAHEEPPRVRQGQGCLELLIYGNGGGYPIAHDRMDTAEKVLGWIRHLSGKRNVTTAHIEAFIDAAQSLGVGVCATSANFPSYAAD